MNIEQHTSRLRDDLLAAAALGDDSTRATAEALARAADTSARLMVLSALSDFASEVTTALGDRSVHVVLDGADARVDVRTDAPAADDSAAEQPHTAADAKAAFDDAAGEISRVTLRLVEQMKARAEDAAAQNGQSLNSWLSQAVQGALRDQMRKSGNNWS
ncbi:hypothetical protein [Antrihabitans cavernicola]|uniref:Toxin-antitoxin system HicB family antitoxin n=1 Tax=Antrihabitans cavernicola TaxID=2495913 RepID=A0A5A7SDP8_9NOCA|nr:hypothetical protein [Spelaeibacter cavernicola]KAA0023312.1 hypothetical protein FOY51_07795 [Spelaeibacter cavernicola]